MCLPDGYIQLFSHSPQRRSLSFVLLCFHKTNQPELRKPHQRSHCLYRSIRSNLLRANQNADGQLSDFRCHGNLTQYTRSTRNTRNRITFFPFLFAHPDTHQPSPQPTSRTKNNPFPWSVKCSGSTANKCRLAKTARQSSENRESKWWWKNLPLQPKAHFSILNLCSLLYLVTIPVLFVRIGLAKPSKAWNGYLKHSDDSYKSVIEKKTAGWV